MGILVAIFALKTPNSVWQVIPATLAAISYLVMTITTILVLFGSNWQTGPKITEFLEKREAGDWSDLRAKWEVVSKMRKDLDDNRKGPYEKRLSGMRTIAISLASQTLFLCWLAGSLANWKSSGTS
jgi:hypothetical protein